MKTKMTWPQSRGRCNRSLSWRKGCALQVLKSKQKTKRGEVHLENTLADPCPLRKEGAYLLRMYEKEYIMCLSFFKM